MKKDKRMKVGETRMRQRGEMVATAWKDKRTVSILSTGLQPEMGSALRQTEEGDKVEKEIPNTVLTYNRHKGGVDVFDQHRCYYTLGRQSRKWWRYLFWFLLESAMVNAFILLKLTTTPSKKAARQHDHHYFRLKLYDGLIKGNVQTRREQMQRESFAGRAVADPAEHAIVRMPGRKKVCMKCVEQKKRTPTGRGVETVFGCAICKVHLCRGQCFARFHAELFQ